MEQTFTYQTSFTKDSYVICKNDKQIGKLYKKEWLCSPIEGDINSQRFRFMQKGFFKPAILVFNKDIKQSVGTIRIDAFFKAALSATFITVDDYRYCWTTKGLFSYNWQWTNLTDGKIVATSHEPLDVFKQQGTIQLAKQDNNEALLIAAGIHLRNVVSQRNLIARIICAIVVMLSLSALFR